MATKTITLELDAYEKLRTAKLPGESFSAVVRRATFDKTLLTAAAFLQYLQEGGSGVAEEYLDSVDAASKHDSAPKDPWA